MKKFSKSVFSLFLVLGSVSAKGAQGFYIAADLGPSYSNIDLTLDDGPLTNIRSKTSNHLVQPNLGLSFGYDHIFQNSMMLGIEAFGDYNLGGKKEISKNQVGPWAATKVKVERKGPGFGILAKIGAKVGQSTAIYIGIGIKSLKHTFSYQDAQPQLRFNFGKRSTRLLAQAGLQGLWGNSEKLGWRASYSYVPGKKVSRTNIPWVPNALISGRGAFINAKASEHSAKVGMFYRL